MPGTTDQTFSDIIRGMQHAVNTAQETLQDYQFRQMQRYFKEDGSPDTIWVSLSDGRGIEVPKITLVPQSLLSIDELEMSFKVRVSGTELKDWPVAEEGGLLAAASRVRAAASRASFQVRFAGHSERGGAEGEDPEVMSVSIKFKAIPTPEGAARVLDRLNLNIRELQA